MKVEGQILKTEEAPSNSPLELTHAQSEGGHFDDSELLEVIKRRDAIVASLREGSTSVLSAIAQIENITFEIEGQGGYDLDYSWTQSDIDLIMDKLNSDSVSLGSSHESLSEEPMPWFLATRSRVPGENRDGVSTLVVNWVSSKIKSGESLAQNLENELASWAQNIHMASLDAVFDLIRQDMISPNLLQGRLISDIITGLSFYDNSGHYSSILKNKALDKNSSFSEVSEAVQILKHFYVHSENAGYGESGNFAKQALEEIYIKRNEFFCKLLIRKVFEAPLSDANDEYKKALLSANGYAIGDVSDTELESVFEGFIHSNYSYCEWLEENNLKSSLATSRGRLYEFGTFIENESDTRNGKEANDSINEFIYRKSRTRKRRKKLEDSTSTRLTHEYGMTYQADGNFSVYPLDGTFEVFREDLVTRYGTEEQDKIEYYAAIIPRCIREGRFLELPRHLVALSLLSEEVRNKIVKDIGVPLPEELINEPDFSVREKYVQEHQQEMEPIVLAAQSGNLTSLIECLNSTTSSMRQEAAETFEGWKNLNPDKLDFYLNLFSYSPQQTNPPHHTFLYYAHIRKYLPESLVKEFEQRSGLELSPESLAVETYDDFLALDGEALIAEFEVVSEENKRWLYAELVNLGFKIKSNLPTVDKVPLKKFLEDNAIPADKLSDSFVLNYSSFLSLDIRVSIETRLGISLSDLGVPAQVALLNFLSTNTERDIQELSTFLEDYEKEDRIAICSCYLAFTDEPNFSYIIERLCEHEDVGIELVRHISSLIGDAESIRSFLQLEFGSQGGNNEVANIHEKLIKEAYDLFLKYNAKIASLETVGEMEYGNNLLEDIDEFENYGHASSELSGHGLYERQRSKILEEIRNLINEKSADKLFFLNSFKTLQENGVYFSLDDIENTEFEVVSGNELKREDVATMRSVYSQNQAEVGAHDEILAHFDERVIDPGTHFYIFKWQGKIQSFVAFTNDGENIFEATSFNVDPSARGYKIGEAMLEEAIAKEAKEHILHGECYANLKISAKYIETGWIAEGYFTEPGKLSNTDDQLINIYRDDAENQQYWGKRTVAPEAVYARESLPEYVRVEESGNQLGLPFHLLNEGHILTRMFYHEPARKFIGVFEVDHRPMKVAEQVKEMRQVKGESSAVAPEGELEPA